MTIPSITGMREDEAADDELQHGRTRVVRRSDDGIRQGAPRCGAP